MKAHVARVVAHPLPYVLDPNEQKVLEEIRKTYDYYHHMDQQANHAEVIPDWLVDKFAIAGSVDQCRAQIERIKETGIQQIAIIPYSPPGGSREETIRGFAKAMSSLEIGHSEYFARGRKLMKIVHTMIRVNDLDESLKFYCDGLGMKL